MLEPPANPWIHIGECPVCVNGLCRVRSCAPPESTMHFYALCDECEALWLSPSTDTPRMFADASEPLCPICGLALYGPQAHWSRPEELQGSEWSTNAIFEVPSTGMPDDDSWCGDSHAQSQPENQADTCHPTKPNDPSYGQEEPRPGC